MLLYIDGAADESAGTGNPVTMDRNPEDSAAAFQTDREAVRRAYLRRIAAGDPSALSALYDHSSGVIFGLALRVLGSEADAEEVAIDVYAQVWRTAGSYDPLRGSVMSWLSTIARSRAIDRLRSLRAAGRSQPLEEAEPLLTETDSEGAALRRLDLKRAHAAVAGLPEDQRRAVALAYFSGMSHSEIASRLDVPVGTVKTRIRLGMMKLRDVLENRI
jgi:RNA polymerase sigma-70 factor (ECF subfamily)